ncbi:hypothetical protein U91I_01261 [alpha proteobacterium U9-1i]|nr:hypothetical protein U91I_01261 [alpha proteobacterium U9-1i]
MRSFTILVFAAVALAACAPTSSTPPPADAVQEAGASLWSASTRTILSGDAARALGRQCSRVSPGPIEGVWTPTDTDAAAVDDQLVMFVARKLEERGMSPSPGGYHRQYAGFVIGGKRVIYVNGVEEQALGLSSNSTFDWRTQPVQICDGGSITFGVEYDPATRQFSNFAFNGPY